MSSSTPLPGYHLQPITRGVLGETSKIREELDELEDAMRQGVSIMALVELSDLYGAIEALLAKHFQGTAMDDLARMAAVTARAFKSGARPPRE